MKPDMPVRPEMKEILRYLGYHGSSPDPQILSKIGRCTDALLKAADFREIHRIFPLSAAGSEAFSIEGRQIQSHSLARNLSGCSSVCLFAATIGLGFDRLLSRASTAGKISDALILQAAGTALVEAWCDRICEDIKKEALAEGFYVRPRFSPGYGDFPLAWQTSLFSILEVSKHTGITLTENLLMMPSKSVTALAGLSRRGADCPANSCVSCDQAASCPYRR